MGGTLSNSRGKEAGSALLASCAEGDSITALKVGCWTWKEEKSVSLSPDRAVPDKHLCTCRCSRATNGSQSGQTGLTALHPCTSP